MPFLIWIEHVCNLTKIRRIEGKFYFRLKNFVYFGGKLSKQSGNFHVLIEYNQQKNSFNYFETAFYPPITRKFFYYTDYFSF